VIEKKLSFVQKFRKKKRKSVSLDLALQGTRVGKAKAALGHWRAEGKKYEPSRHGQKGGRTGQPEA